MVEEPRRPEICIVGGGLTGLATAFYLQQQPALRHANIRLIEAQQKVGGRYVATAYADAGVLHSLLQVSSDRRQSAASDAVGATPPHDLLPLVQQALESRLLLKHRSVSATALQPFEVCNSSGEAGGSSRNGKNGHGGRNVPMEFGATVPHFLAPGGGHVLKLSQQLLMPSQLVTGRRQAASLFSLMRATKRPTKMWSWLPLRGRESSTKLSSCRPGLSRLIIGQALIAGIRELCRKRGEERQQICRPRLTFLEPGYCITPTVLCFVEHGQNAVQLIEALEKHIEAPPLDQRPVSVVRGSRVVRVLSAAADRADCTSGRAAEVVCDDGSNYSCDLVICALHPYDVGALLCSSASLKDSANSRERAPAAGHDQHRVTGKGSQREESDVSTMASLLLAVPCASWVTVHAFAEYSTRHANSLGGGCFYGPHQLEQMRGALAESQERLTKQGTRGDEAREEVAQAVAGLSEAIRAAQEAVAVAELQLPANVFPHSHAAAMAAAGLFDQAAANWVTSAPMLHARAAVRVRRLESLVEQMQHLLLPLQRLVQPSRTPYGERGDDLGDWRAVGLRALGLLTAVAEDTVVRALLREKITTAPDQLLVCSQLSLQAEPQWPLTLEKNGGVCEAKQRQRLFYLMQQYEDLRGADWRSCPAFHASCSEVPQGKQAEASLLHPEHPGHEQLLEAGHDGALPEFFADARLLFHRLRVDNTPWLQVVGPAGSLSEWGAGARVKDACILANQVAQQ
ncbi:hypothetical protein ACSSS7_005981 [Eimeria intestinalis]